MNKEQGLQIFSLAKFRDAVYKQLGCSKRRLFFGRTISGFVMAGDGVDLSVLFQIVNQVQE